jgi:hypothetical protein
MSKKNDIWENFIFARDRLYPLENKEDNYTSVYNASLKLLEKKLSKFQVSTLAKKGIIRQNEKKQVYIKDIELIKLLIESIDIFQKEGYIEASKDYQGRKVIAVFPLESKKNGKTLIESQTDALATILKNTFIQEWSKNMIN